MARKSLALSATEGLKVFRLGSAGMLLGLGLLGSSIGISIGGVSGRRDGVYCFYWLGSEAKNAELSNLSGLFY